jgi:membrane-bound lytic murein transglycosylase D
MPSVRFSARPGWAVLLGAWALAACQPGLQPLTAPVPSSGSGPAADRASALSDLTSPDAVMAAATAVFGDSTHFDGTLAEEPTWDIDVRSYETHERVEYYLQRFSGPASDRIAQYITRGSRYEPMIRAKMRAAGMPEDMFYLALIESGYDPHAYSSAAAVGMWQFMAATGREVGLRVDWWADERRDPARSTDAAIRFLGALQRQFGSLYLAAAAYNGGPGRVARGLTQFASAIGDAEGDDKFFALAEQNYLHSETKNYVPQLIAAAIVAKTPDRFGLTVERLSPYGYDSVLVEAGTSLGALATAAAIPLDSLIELNPALIRGVAPPDRSEWVRVPLGTDSLVAAVHEALEPEERLGWTLVTPNRGETLAALARRHEVSTRDLGWYNPGLRMASGGVIASGQTVRVPTREALAGARPVADPSIERYGGSAGGVHVVRRGESLGVIARRYGVTVTRLKALNDLRSDRILVGQTLVVRAGAAPTRATTTASRTSSTGSGAASGGASGTTTHVVVAGESLGVIAQRYGTTVERVKSLNNLRSDRIRIGQRLVVRRS